MKLYRDLDVTQKSAWHLAHRLRECWSQKQEVVPSPVEVDETYIGGIDANKDADKKTQHGNSYGVKQPVVGMKSRETNQIKADVLQTVSAKTLQRYVNEFAGRHNFREQDTIDQMAFLARNLVGKRFRYQDLVS